MKKFLRFLLIKLPLALIALSLLAVVATRYIPVWWTPLMVKRAIEYRGDESYHFQRKWTRLEDITPEMVKSVVASEDNRFATHNGFEWDAIRKEIEKSQKTGKKARGCSTISQQTAKNVFTLGDRSMLRKGVESYFTFLIEKIWGKRRIMEVYLNVAEMGKGVYGVGAAAQKHFGTTPAKLTRRQCALITACLPNPVKRDAAKPTAYINKRAGQIVSLIGKIDFGFVNDYYKED